MAVELTAIHWVYLIFVLIIMTTMLVRRDTTVACVVGIFIIGLLAKGSLHQAVSGVYNSFIIAISELLGTILVISVIYALSRALFDTGINAVMVAPFTRLMSSPATAFWVIGLLMMTMSWFFWPSPAVALMGAVLLPAAVRAGLPAIGVAMAMNLFGHGIALSGDFVIQGAPKLTADAAGIPVQQVVTASVPLVLVMAVTTVAVAFWQLRKDLQAGTLVSGEILTSESAQAPAEIVKLPPRLQGWLAVIIPLGFLLDVAVMYYAKLQGGDATALIGGTAVIMLMALAGFAYGRSALEQVSRYLTDGFQFGFRIFGPVIPIAAFFYLGDSAFSQIFGKVLPAGSQGIVNDLGLALAQVVPLNAAAGAITLATVGAITGLDGSGFSGISLAGSIAKLFSHAIGGIDTLTALGQITAIWVGGGTLVPWALIPAAAICGVNPFVLARRNLFPVLVGFAVTTVVAAFLI